jgi:F0F1-type ATP synthase assembly protein I
MADDDSSNWGRMAGTGFEFAVAILMFGGIGWWLDSLLNTKPWLLIVGCGLGFVVGLWRMIKIASRTFRN